MTTTSKTQSTYRADIDGLRAIAVMAVLIFHIKASFLPGGFAGVDVFFVISGFLITSNIARGISAEHFSFAEFYRRRILRIIPPLMIVAITSLILGQLLFLPEDLEKLAWSAAASALSVANIYFYAFLDTSYFAADASVNPLLHLWSLGVEEQFYIFWPIILIWLMAIKPRSALWLTLGIGTASFLFAEFMVSRNPMFAYYMLPTRAGQLLAGASVFFLMRTHNIDLGLKTRTTISVVGTLLLFASLIFISEDIPYPGNSAIPVTLGTALIIFSGCMGPNIVNRFIGNRISVFIGLISYSLYLWHWPIFAFYKYLFGSFTFWSGFLATALVFGLTYLTYLYIEKPVRAWKAPLWPVVRNLFLAPTLAITALLFSVISTSGYGLHILTSYPDRLTSSRTPVQHARLYSYICQSYQLTKADLTTPDCLINTQTEPKVLLWGDSNAAHFTGLLGALAESERFGFRNIAHSSCPPLLNNASQWGDPQRPDACQSSSQLVAGIVDNYDVIILSASWERPLNSQNQSGRQELENTIKTLTGRGKKIILMGKIPRLRDIDILCNGKKLKVPLINCGEQGKTRDAGEREFNTYLQNLAAEDPNVTYYSVRKYFCDGTSCSPYLGDLNAYFDSGHLSISGSWEMGRIILREEGLPPAFNALREVAKTTYKTSDLQKSLHQEFAPKIALVEESGIEILSGALQKSWRAQPISNEANTSYTFVDDTTERFRTYSYNVHKGSPDSTSEKPILGNVHARFEISSTNTPTALFRIEQQTDPRLRYDAVVNLKSNIITAKSEAQYQSIQLHRNKDRKTLYITVKDVDLRADINLRIFPASSIGEDTGYKKSATGEIDLYSVKVFVETHEDE